MSAETKEEIDALANSANAQVSDLADGARLLLDSHQEGCEVSVAVLLGRIEELANAMCELVLYGTGEHRRSVIEGRRPG